MGGTCSKIVSVKTSTIFKNRVHSVSLPQDGPGKVEGSQAKPIEDSDLCDKNLHKVTIDANIAQLEPPDFFSKGDHNRDSSKQIDLEVNTTRAEQCTRSISQNNLAQGDFKLDDKSNCYQKIQVIETPDLQGESANADEKQSTAPQDCENTDDDVIKDSNDNSYTRLPDETQGKYTLDLDSNSDETDDNSVPLTPRDAAPLEDKEDDDNQDETESVHSIPQDSLFFLPIASDLQQSQATYKIPQRLNRSRKPPLSYSERMLLADCNRFQQLDKKREFAVRRNRSISRIGKLPKLNDASGDSSETDLTGNNTLNNPDF